MTNIIDLYRQDVDGRQIRLVSRSSKRGQEFRGPCPGCGGDDRFAVWPDQNRGEGSFFCGHAKGVGNGCGKGGDAIQYLREFRGLSYQEACRFLGREPKGGGGRHLRYQTPQAPRASRQPERFLPEDKGYPEEVVDPVVWRQKGMEFVERCHQALLERPMSIAYLAARGIDLDGIRAYRLGFHGGVERDGRDYQPDFRPWPSWGLRQEKNAKGGWRCVKLEAGLVIPYFVDDLLRCLTVRKVRVGKNEPKYDYVKGSVREMFLTNPSAKAFVVVESMFDAIAVDVAAGDLVGAVGVGTTGMRPDLRAAAVLDGSLCILGGLDNDAAGIAAGEWWASTYRQYRRWPVPEGKDPGEFFERGGDLRAWILAGLPPALLPEEEIRRMEEMNRSQHPELDEFKQILYAADGQFRVYDQGWSVGPVLPERWAAEHPERARRFARLLHQSDAVGDFIAGLKDGLYGYRQVPGVLAN
ncbi:MAG: primase-helicase zinc-binding domain-containing protein [Desulfofustis sp.]|nr:primase-helicase zinc-binding domain-containing protein [Desulfofustis sp.]